jgi:hypothetical protein
MRICALLRHGSVALGLLVLSSCASQGALKPTDHTAVVKGDSWGKVYRGGYVEIAYVNGIEPGWRLHSAMVLGVGDQNAVFYVYLRNGGTIDCMSIAQAQIGFRTEADHTYQVHAREQVNGSNRFWVWIEDQATGKVVGGTTPPAAPAS